MGAIAAKFVIWLHRRNKTPKTLDTELHAVPDGALHNSEKSKEHLSKSSSPKVLGPSPSFSLEHSSFVRPLPPGVPHSQTIPVVQTLRDFRGKGIGPLPSSLNPVRKIPPRAMIGRNRPQPREHAVDYVEFDENDVTGGSIPVTPPMAARRVRGR